MHKLAKGFGMNIRLRSFRAKRAPTPVGAVPELFHTSLLSLVGVDFQAEIVARTMQVTTVFNSARAKKDLSKRRRCAALMFGMMRTSTRKNYDALSFHSFESIVRSSYFGDHSCESSCTMLRLSSNCFLRSSYFGNGMSAFLCKIIIAHAATDTKLR